MLADRNGNEFWWPCIELVALQRRGVGREIDTPDKMEIVRILDAIARYELWIGEKKSLHVCREIGC